MGRFFSIAAAGILSAVTLSSAITPSFTGYLDSDVWTDFAGNFYTNHELDVGMSMAFTDAVSANLYVTMRAGMVPARLEMPVNRWSTVNFDGLDVTFTTKMGTFSVGDLVYQYGKFNYYFYKRLSMITTENFTRGVKYSVDAGALSQSFYLGAADLTGSAGDFVGSSCFKVGEGLGLDFYYGLRGDIDKGFKNTGTAFGGIEARANLGENLAVKLDAAYRNFPVNGERGSVISLLCEPTLTLGSFTTAGTVYAMFDPDSVNAINGSVYGVDDEVFGYIEPGYTINDNIAVGLPLEIHGYDMENKEDNQFWTVPTFYVYPTKGVQWWIWGQAGIPLGDNDGDGTRDDNFWGLGSEIIVQF
jgi:hypothetical protein